MAPSWFNRSGGPLDLPPLVATTRSSLLRIDGYRERLHAVVDLVLKAGADPNRTVSKRWKASADASPQEWQVSALHGAAGVNYDAGLWLNDFAAEQGDDEPQGDGASKSQPDLFSDVVSKECLRAP